MDAATLRESIAKKRLEVQQAELAILEARLSRAEAVGATAERLLGGWAPRAAAAVVPSTQRAVWRRETNGTDTRLNSSTGGSLWALPEGAQLASGGVMLPAPRLPAVGAWGGGGGGGGGGEFAAAPVAGRLRGHCVVILDHRDEGGVWALAVVEGAGLVSGGSEKIRTWARGADRGLRSAAGRAHGIAALPGGGRFATAGFDTNLVEVWDAGTGQRLHQLRGHTDRVNCVGALPEGLFASGGEDGTVRIWSAATGARVDTLEGHFDGVCALAALPDGRLASGSWDRTTRLWNVATRACTQVLQHPDSVCALAALHGGRLASGCADGSVYVWSAAGGALEVVLEGHTDTVFSLAALPSGLIASGSGDSTVRVWDVGARACVAVLEGHWCAAVLEGHGRGVSALAALPDGRLASGSRNDPLIRVWALTAPGTPQDAAAAAAAAAARAAAVAPGWGPPLRGRCVAKLDHGGKDVWALAVVESAGLVSSGADGGEGPFHLRAWAAGASRVLWGAAGRAVDIAALPSGRFVTACGREELVEVWDAGSGQRLYQQRHTSGVCSVGALPGGLFASGGHDGAVSIWSEGTGAHVATLEGHAGAVLALAARPDGRLASASADKTIRLWDVAARACTLVLTHPRCVSALAVLDGGRLASGCDDKNVHVWPTADGGAAQRVVLRGHTREVRSLAALPGGLLASGSCDRTVRVWDVGARACVAVLRGHGGVVRALAALPDGRLASGSERDPLVRVWALTAPGTPEDAAAAAAAAAHDSPHDAAVEPAFADENAEKM
jgi:WD40 repeat protein